MCATSYLSINLGDLLPALGDLPDDDGVEDDERGVGHELHDDHLAPGAQFNRKHFGLRNHLSFGNEIPYTKKRFKNV